MHSFIGRRSTTAETTAAAAQLGVTTNMFILIVVPWSYRNFSEGSVQQHPSPCSFRKRVGRKRKNTEQDQPAVRSAVAAAAAAAAEVRFSMTCRFVDGQGKRGNVHIPAIRSVAFPDVVVFDGFI